MHRRLSKLKRGWHPSSSGQECTFHQLAPYIGKLKSSVANALVREYSSPGGLVFDPFCGSGVVPLEALALGRGALASDISPYAVILSRGKMFAPADLPTALEDVHA